MSPRSRFISVALLLLTPVLTFWIWLLILDIKSSWLCPRGCWCDPDGDVLDCTNASLKEVPHIYHNRIYQLYLDHNNLSQLGKEVFASKNIFNIEELNLKYCKISYIDTDAFKGLVLLRILSLQHNLLTELKVGTFANITMLTRLYLEDNRIENLEVGIFEGLASLKLLDLEHNLLNSLRSDVFHGLTDLKFLWLSHNRLSTLHPDVFKHLSKLNYLYLNGNEDLQVESNSSLLNIPTLEDLYLSDCNISRILPKSFENLTNLTVLDMRNNNLKTIDENIFRVLPGLTDLLLYGNPLECDCGLLEVWRWCQEHDIEVGKNTEVARCESPDQVSGMWWGVLGKAQCNNGSVTFEEGYKTAIPTFVTTDEIYHDHDASYKHFVTYVQPVIYIFLFIFGTIGNMTVLVVVICNSEMHTVPNVYITNLAVSDLISLCTNILLNYINEESESWQLGVVSCKMFGFFRHLSVGVSAYLISVMSIQRYQAISKPLHNRLQSMTRITTIATILGVWIVCSLFTIPYTSAMHVDDFIFCTINFDSKYYGKVVVFELLVFCILPLGVTVCMYCLTARHLMRSTNIASGENHNQRNSRRSTTRIVLGFTVVFVISFLPYHILLTCFISGKFGYPIELLHVLKISTYLLIFNSCFNPVALCSSECYRRYFKHYLLKCCGRKSPIAADSTKK